MLTELLPAMAMAFLPGATICVLAIGRSKSPKTLLTWSLGGAVSVLPAFALSWLSSDFLNALPFRFPLLRPFFVPALAEESVRLVLIILLSRRLHLPSDSFKRIGLLLGAAFALVENAFYLSQPISILALRAITTLPIHSGLAFLQIRGRGKTLLSGTTAPTAFAFALAVVIHGLYSLFLQIGFWPGAWGMAGLAALTLLL